MRSPLKKSISTSLRALKEVIIPFMRHSLRNLSRMMSGTFFLMTLRAAGLLALRTVAEAYGGLGAVAAEAGISRESLYRALSPKGNPTLKTLLAVLKTVGLRLSVEPEKHARAPRITRGCR